MQESKPKFVRVFLWLGRILSGLVLAYAIATNVMMSLAGEVPTIWITPLPILRITLISKWTILHPLKTLDSRVSIHLKWLTVPDLSN